jgi:hypothetical protein
MVELLAPLQPQVGGGAPARCCDLPVQSAASLDAAARALPAAGGKVP